MTPAATAPAGPVLLASTAELKGSWFVTGLMLLGVAAITLAPLGITLLPAAPGVKVSSSFVGIAISLFVGIPALVAAARLLLLRSEVLFDPAGGGSLVLVSGLAFSRSYDRVLLRSFDRVAVVQRLERHGERFSVELRGPSQAPLPLCADLGDHYEAMSFALRAAALMRLPIESIVGARAVMLPAEAIARRMQSAALDIAPEWWRAPGAKMLVFANVLPLFGVLFLGWSLLAAMLFVWLENIVVGLVTVLRIVLARRDRAAKSGRAQPLSGVFRAVTFLIPYGVFTAVHGCLVFALFGLAAESMAGRPAPDPLVLAKATFLRLDMLVSIAALVATHLMLFYRDYLEPRAYESADAAAEAGAPIWRVVLLHFVLIFGGGAAMLMGKPLLGLVPLIVLKTIAEVIAHRQRERSRPPAGIDALMRELEKQRKVPAPATAAGAAGSPRGSPRA